MELLVRKPAHAHVSYDTVEELESAILADPRVKPVDTSRGAAPVLSAATRLLRKAGLNPAGILAAQAAPARDSGSHDYLAVMMDQDAAPLAYWLRRAARKSVYLFDAWPSRHQEILRFVDDWGITHSFVSSSQAAMRLAARPSRCEFTWIPEGVDPSRYRSRPPSERDIDVLQLGRKHDSHHAVILPALRDAGRTYLFERRKGEIVFPGRDDFVDGLSRARISICVPSSVTHPERAGDIETMTIRYLQSMVSRCIVLGHAPSEMKELFGYDPVVEIDYGDPAGQVLDMLERYDEYLPLVERNFQTVTRDHTWSRRWDRMAASLLDS